MTGAGGGGSLYAFLKPGEHQRFSLTDSDSHFFIYSSDSIADTSQTIVDMITTELTKLGFEIWRPSLGGYGVVYHEDRPDVFGAAK